MCLIVLFHFASLPNIWQTGAKFLNDQLYTNNEIYCKKKKKTETQLKNRQEKNYLFFCLKSLYNRLWAEILPVLVESLLKPSSFYWSN